MEAKRLPGRRPRAGLILPLALILGLVGGGRARGQNAQFNIDDPSKAGGTSSVLGRALGAANFSDGAPASVKPISGKAGPQGTHAPIEGLTNPTGPTGSVAQTSLKIQSTPAAPLPNYGNLALPNNLGLALGPEAYGPEDGMTIDAAIEALVRENLDLLAARLEIPMAEADVLTASLRANPVFYADQQLIPYGHFSYLRPGGPNQTDINLNIPFDVNGKRKARVRSAEAAKKVTQAQLQDAIRNQIDNLYTVYVDAVAARLTLQFSRVALTGISKLLADYEALEARGEKTRQDVDVFLAQKESALVQVREAVEAVAKTQEAIAVILNAPPDQAAALQVRDIFRDVREIPEPTEALIKRATDSRPDLVAIKIGVNRANADVTLAKRNAFPDIYATWQPYTFQNNQYLGVNSAYSYTFGVTANVPLFNRNQGNIKRAKINVGQTELQVRSLERTVMQDVMNAVREFDLSRKAIIDQEDKIVPASRRVRDAAEAQFRGGDDVVGRLHRGPAGLQRRRRGLSRRPHPAPPGHARPEHRRGRADLLNPLDSPKKGAIADASPSNDPPRRPPPGPAGPRRAGRPRADVRRAALEHPAAESPHPHALLLWSGRPGPRRVPRLARPGREPELHQPAPAAGLPRLDPLRRLDQRQRRRRRAGRRGDDPDADPRTRSPANTSPPRPTAGTPSPRAGSATSSTRSTPTATIPGRTSSSPAGPRC